MILKNRLLYLSLIIGCLLSKNNIQANHEQHIQKISTEDAFLSLLDDTKASIVFCFMDNCPYCKMINIIFEKLSHLPQYKKIQFAKANGPRLHIHQHVARESKNQFQIPGYPVFVFINNKKIDRILIGANKEKLETALKEFYSK